VCVCVCYTLNIVSITLSHNLHPYVCVLAENFGSVPITCSQLAVTFVLIRVMLPLEHDAIGLSV